MKNTWQLKTTPIRKEEEDKLSHNILANLLKSKTEELFSIDDIPSCFCLNGEYGSGKSSIANLFLQKYAGDCKKKIIHFNAWRHKNENLYYALLRNIYYVLNNKEKKDFRNTMFLEELTANGEIRELDVEFTKLVYANVSIKTTDQDSITNKFEDFVKTKVFKVSKLFSWYLLKQVGFFALILAGLAFLLSFLAGHNEQSSFYIGISTFITLFLSGPFLVFFLEKNADILPKIVELNILPDETTVNLPNIYNTEQLQCLFRQLLDDGKAEQIIIIVEDIDRKNNDEIIKALNDLRTFIDLGEAVFIIPCDLNNIERAFKEVVVDNQTKEDVDWKSRDFCTKIFSHIITIPLQNKQDLRIFLINKIKENGKHPLSNLLTEDQLDDLIDILVVQSVKTPRETINMFNKFTLELEYAIALENEGKRLKKGTITKHILEYARIFMLSSHYRLENELLLNPQLPFWIVSLYKNEESLIPKSSLPKSQEIFKKLSEDSTMEVIEFISRTEDYYSELTRAFIYLDETAYSGNIGNESYNRILTALKNRNITKLAEQLQNDDLSGDTNEAITKIIHNVSYSSDIKNILYSLVECYSYLNISKRDASKFIVEHFNAIGQKQLYAFNSNTILDIISDSPRTKHSYAKNLYFKIIGEEETSEIISSTDLFELEIALILKLNIDPKFVNNDIASGLSQNLEIALSSKDEELQQVKDLCVAIERLSDESIKWLITPNVVKRIISQINIAKDDVFEEIRPIILRLVNILLSKQTLKALDSLNSPNGDILYLDISDSLKNGIMAQGLALDVETRIQEQIIKGYLSEDAIDINDTIILDKAILLFALYDGHYFKTYKKGSTPFNNLSSILKNNISTTSDFGFLKYNLKIIDIIEDNAGYSFYNSFTEVFVEKIRTGIIEPSTPTEEKYIECQAIIDHLVINNRIVSLKDENIDKYKEVFIPTLKVEIQHNRANSAKADYIVKSLLSLCRLHDFEHTLVGWLESENVLLPENTTQLSLYEYHLELLDHLQLKLSEPLLKNLFNKLIAVTGNSSSSISEPSWERLEKLSQTVKDETLWKGVIDRFVSFFPNRNSYFNPQIVKRILNILYKICSVEQLTTYLTQCSTLLIESLESDFEDNFDLLNIWLEKISLENQMKIVSLIEEHKYWEKSNTLINNNSSYFEEIACELYHNEAFDVFDNICKQINKDSIIVILNLIIVREGESITTESVTLLTQYFIKYETTIEELKENELSAVIMKLLQSDFNSKLQALELMKIIQYQVNKGDDLYNSIDTNFVSMIDSSTEFDIVGKLNEYLISFNLKKGSGFNKKVKEIMELCENEDLKNKYKSLLKYGK